MPKSPRTFIIIALCVLAAIIIAGGSVFYIERMNMNRAMTTTFYAEILGKATFEYEQDHSTHYPDAGKWEQELKPYVDPKAKNIFHPPAPVGGTERRFSLNPTVAGKTDAQIAGMKAPWLFYESVSKQPSAADDLEYWPDPKRDGGTDFVVVYTRGYGYPRPLAWKAAVRQNLPGL